MKNETIKRLDEYYAKQQLTEMSRIGFTDDGFEVYVNTDDDGNIPHFHYRTKDTWDFHSCIKIKEVGYFEHTSKENKLNSKQRKELVKFLNSQPRNKRYKTNWERILAEWNDNNSSEEVDEEMEMPNYLNLK